MKTSIANRPVSKNGRSRVYLMGSAMITMLVAGAMVLVRAGPAAAGSVAAPSRHPSAMEQRADHHHSRAVSTTATAPTALEEQWGIKVSSVTLANAASAVDVRYVVLSPEKTTMLNGANAEVYLIDQASGTKLPMITAAPTSDSGAMPSRSVRNMMRLAGRFPPPSSRLTAGGVYSVKIPNWESILTSGATVALVVGGVRVDNLVVE
jgi:hypothetical protein